MAVLLGTGSAGKFAEDADRGSVAWSGPAVALVDPAARRMPAPTAAAASTQQRKRRMEDIMPPAGTAVMLSPTVRRAWEGVNRISERG
ncbi:MAG TPA: hypothetical protein VFA63_04885 [Pseudonocardiaceae bacterium]|nr:hypothetical protein [Pseudonocardiaceae bacterium]